MVALPRSPPGTPAEAVARSRFGRPVIRQARHVVGYFEPWQVFTARGSPPRAVFADRQNIQRALRNAILQNNTHVFVAGPSGVGKTALVDYVLKSLHLKTRWVYPDETEAGDSRSAILVNLIAAGGAEPTEHTGEREGSAEMSSPFASLGGRLTSSTTSRFPAAGRLYRTFDALQRSKTDVIFIDDFDRFLEPGTTDSLYATVARLLHSVSVEHVNRPTTIIIAGPRQHLDLLIADEKVASRVKMIHLGAMGYDELADFYSRAQDQLGIQIAGDALTELIESSSGLPPLAHLLGEESVSVTLARKAKLVTQADVMAGIAVLLADAGPLWRAAKAYDRALQASGGNPTYRRLLIEALASADDLQVAIPALEAAYSGLERRLMLHDQVPLALPLGELIAGSVVETPNHGSVAFMYPMLRAYVRLRSRHAELFDNDMDVETRYESP